MAICKIILIWATKIPIGFVVFVCFQESRDQTYVSHVQMTGFIAK